ncbi:hypothetical protein D9M68_585440 [compost metagenome]
MRHRTDVLQALRREVQPEVRFVHGRDRMHAHDRMAVDAVDLGGGACAGEQLGETAIASDAGLSAHDGHQRVGHVTAQFLHGDADIADVGRAVEGGTAFVVQHAGAGAGHESADAAQLCLHFGGRHAAGRAGDAQGVQPACPPQLLRRGHAQEQQAAQAGAGNFRERIGGAGEVVAVPGDPRRGGAALAAVHARFPKNSMARRSSGAWRA